MDARHNTNANQYQFNFIDWCWWTTISSATPSVDAKNHKHVVMLASERKNHAWTTTLGLKVPQWRHLDSRRSKRRQCAVSVPREINVPHRHGVMNHTAYERRHRLPPDQKNLHLLVGSVSPSSYSGEITWLIASLTVTLESRNDYSQKWLSRRARP